MDTRLHETRKDVKSIDKKLYGNGNQGLVSDVIINTTRIKNGEKNQKRLAWGISIGFTALGILITLFSIYN